MLEALKLDEQLAIHELAQIVAVDILKSLFEHGLESFELVFPSRLLYRKSLAGQRWIAPTLFQRRLIYFAKQIQRSQPKS